MTTAHVVLIGAARSGTKILRDGLAEAMSIGRVPYDIGYVWRYGHERYPDDTLGAQDSSERTRAFIRGFVNRYALGNPPSVIEKTVGNVMRLGLVADVFPEARYVHLIRDGVDVIESTWRQWTAPSDIRYLLRKSRHFPLRLVPSYGQTYIQSMMHRRGRNGARVGSWGPRYPGIDVDLAQSDLLAVCARQWRNSVIFARRDLVRLQLPVIDIRYQDLVRDPGSELARVASFVGLKTSPLALATAARRVTSGHDDMGRRSLSDGELALVDAEVGELLAELGCAPARRAGSP